jgi:hypothetical protein
MPDFIPGMELCQHFYRQAVRPVLDTHYPHLAHSAAHLGRGSDVLGFDTHQSRDHHWGPKVTLFLTEADWLKYSTAINDLLSGELPYQIQGYPTNFRDLHIDGGHMHLIETGPVNHAIQITTIQRYFQEYIGVEPGELIPEIAWLAIPQQRLRTIASGRVFFDGLNQLESARKALNWYPQDVWIYLLANQWRRIDQEEPFMARCGDVGDELGSRLIAARQVNEIIRLCFLMERQYIPYYKWIGTAFSHISCAKYLIPIFQDVFDSKNWEARQNHLSRAYLHIAEMHNTLGLTAYIAPELSNFYDRPYLVPHSSRFVDALHEAIQSEIIQALPPHAGAIGQFVDSTDILDSIQRMKVLLGVYK